MPRGRAWSQAEIENLLALIKSSEEAPLLMASTSRPNEALWQKISHGLALAGYERSVAQCRSKWKALKQAFHSEREKRRTAGQHSPELSEHYRTMKCIWKASGRPIFGERKMSDKVGQPSRKRRTAPLFRLMPTPEFGDARDTSCMLSPLLKCEKDEPECSTGGDHIAGAPLSCSPVPCHHTALKQERNEQNASFPGETFPGMRRGNQVLPMAATAPSSPWTAAMSEQLAADEEVLDTSLHGSSVSGLLQGIQQLLVQILQTSQQQQALLESLAKDTVSNLYELSHSLVQVSETLHQLLLQPQVHLGQFMPHVPFLEHGSSAFCFPNAPNTSQDYTEDPQVFPDTSCNPP